MHPRHVHYMCDSLLLLPFIGILMSIYLSTNTLDIDVLTIKDIFVQWKQQPLHILQQSHSKTCYELGMRDLIEYDWPGTAQGCLCENKTKVYPRKCTENQFRKHCKHVEALRPYKAYKWKNQYLCGKSTSKSMEKGYFDMVRIKEGDFCAYKTKKCGKIDTLNNYLCIPEGENCPINDISIVSNAEDSFELTSSNKNVEDGIIYTSYKLGENKHICINNKQHNFINEKTYSLFHNKTLQALMHCSEFKANETKTSIDKHYKLFDSYNKKSFYIQNGISGHIRQLPMYPNITSSIDLYFRTYVGWKKECEVKEFFQFMNNETYVNKEINDIVSITNHYKWQMYLLSGCISLLFLIGIYDIKYRLILKPSYKIEVDLFSFMVCLLIYIAILVLSGCLVYISYVCMKVVDNATITNAFFDMVYNNNCSDSETNFIMKYLAEEFFSYANRFFNIKALGICDIIMCVIILIYTHSSKRNYDYRRAKKEKEVNFFNFE